MTSSPNTDDTMDARVEALYNALLGLGWPLAERDKSTLRQALTASDAIALAPHPQFFAVDYTGCIHSFGSEDDAIKAAQQFAETANGGTPTLTRSALLAAQAPQQPVAWRVTDAWGHLSFGTDLAYLQKDWRGTRAVIEPLYASPPREEDVQRLVATPISPSDPSAIIAGIKQFGLASDGADLRDLEAAIERLAEAIAAARREALEEAAISQRQVRALTALAIQYVKDAMWTAYVVGFQNQKKGWWPGGMSDAEWLERELELDPDAINQPAEVKARIPAAAKALVERALIQIPEGE